MPGPILSRRAPRPLRRAFRAAVPFLALLAVPATFAQSDGLPLAETRTPTPGATAAAATTDRIIVRLRERADTGGSTMSDERVQALSGMAGMTMTPVRVTGSGAHVMRLPVEMGTSDLRSMLERLMQDPSVEHAEPDRRVMPQLVPTDQRYPLQWNLQGAGGGIDAERAWGVTQGSANVVVAVLDTGILRGHREFNAARLLPGHDFVSADRNGGFAAANDGNGRDADPADPGDFVGPGEAGRGPFAACRRAYGSSWHGTHIAGIIAATGNNASGIAGVDWNARVLPVRVLGKCGGYASDTTDGLRWAAGLAVPGVPANPTPAQVVNLSLGGPGRCSREEQAAIDAALGAGVRAIVVAAGNDAQSSLDASPANCERVITVTAVDRNGSRAAQYANVGANVAVAAPGGSGAGPLDPGAGVLSLSNSGTTVPVADALAFQVGTSGAAAHVSGVASLMLAVNPALSPYQVYWTLRQSARRFPDATCNAALCGSGIVDAHGAVQRAATPPPDPATGGQSFLPGPAAAPVAVSAPVATAPAPGTPAAPAPVVTPSPAPGPTPATMPAPPVQMGATGPTSMTASSGATSPAAASSGGGGCTIGSGDDPDWLIAALLLAGLAGLRRSRPE